MPQFHEITCNHDGVPLKGYFARPEGVTGLAPAVIAFPGASGGEKRMKMTVTKLAALGYVAAAVSMYDAREDTSDQNVAGKFFMELQEAPNLLRERARLWFDTFAALDGIDTARLAALGYCFGGKCVLEIARSGADARAIVSYHGLLTTHAPAQRGEIKALVAAYCAGRDPYVPIADIEGFRQEMAAADVAFHVTEFSEAEHAFTDPDASSHGMEGIAYDPLAEAVSWAGTVALLDQTMR